VKWPVHMPPATLPEGEREWVEGPTQSDLDTLLRDTPFAPVPDRTGRVHRTFLPDHAHYVGAAVGFVAYNFEDDPIMCLVHAEQINRLCLTTVMAQESAPGAVRHGGLFTTIPDGNLATQPSAALIGAAPGYAKSIMDLRVSTMVKEAIRGPQLLRSIGLLEEIQAKHGQYTDPNHFYVYMICASPMQRGKGVGSIIMNKLKALCDVAEHQSELYLENSKEKNLGFYHGKHMLQVYEMLVVSRKSGNCPPVPLYVMKRKPGADGVPVVVDDRTLEDVATPYMLNHL
ncbi:hypothetical protein KIPB_008648, partial [Kipferlia bialata]